MRKFLITSALALLVLTSFTSTQAGDVVNYYGISPTLVYDNHPYNLVWSSHPNENYYKHEYVLKGDVVDHFHDLIIIDFIRLDVPVKTAVDDQVQKLEERKKTDVLCNYSLLKNDEEYILDFTMSEPIGNMTNILEWNAYHYKAYTDSAGHKGVLLLGKSHRAYFGEVTSFLNSLKHYRKNQLLSLSKYPIPDIQVK